MEPTSIIDLALMSIIVLVFLLPLIFKQVGGNQEAFLFVMALILLGNGLEVVIDKYLIVYKIIFVPSCLCGERSPN